jgi:hypothetical protein
MTSSFPTGYNTIMDDFKEHSEYEMEVLDYSTVKLST